MRLEVKCKVWLEYDGKPLLGQGRYQLLKSIQETGSLKKSASKNGLAYRTVHNYVKRMEQRLGEAIIESKRGGKEGGGSVTLTDTGKQLIKEYEQAKKRMST